MKNTHGGVLLAVKVTLLHGCFSPFLNCTNSTKSRNASHTKAPKCFHNIFEVLESGTKDKENTGILCFLENIYTIPGCAEAWGKEWVTV